MTPPKPSASTPAAPPPPPSGVTATIIDELGHGVSCLATVAVPLAVTAADTLTQLLTLLVLTLISVLKPWKRAARR